MTRWRRSSGRVGLWVVFTDPPVHPWLRGVLGRVFTGRAVELRRPRVELVTFVGSSLTTSDKHERAATLGADPPEWLDSLVFRGMRSLPVALG